MQCDAIVNTTNRNMIGLSGVDFAVHQKAGASLDHECEKIAPLEKGFAKITKGHGLDCKYIIHTYAPRWIDGLCGERAIIKSCYLESLHLAKRINARRLLFH